MAAEGASSSVNPISRCVFVSRSFRTFILAGLIVATPLRWVQGQSKTEFERIFDKETRRPQQGAHSPDFKNVHITSTLPDTLPKWFFQLPQSGSAATYSIGISDPDLVPQQAYHQALHRAKALAVLKRNCRIQYYRDVFTSVQSSDGSEEHRERFDTYLKFTSASNADTSSFKLISSHFTRFNEAIILIAYSPTDHQIRPEDRIAYTTQATVLYIEAQFDDVFEPQSEYELTTAFRFPNGTTNTSVLTVTKKGNRERARSEFNGVLMEFPVYTYRYADPRWPRNTMPLVTYNGLWGLYTRELLRQLSLSAEQSTVRIRSLAQASTPGTKNLSREIAVLNSNINLNGIVFGRDSIAFSFQIQEK